MLSILKVFGAPISWFSRKQSVIALSSREVEYIAESYAACQSFLIESVFKELKVMVIKPLVLQLDNMSAINLTKKSDSSWQEQDIEAKFHFLRKHVN